MIIYIVTMLWCAPFMPGGLIPHSEQPFMPVLSLLLLLLKKLLQRALNSKQQPPATAYSSSTSHEH